MTLSDYNFASIYIVRISINININININVNVNISRRLRDDWQRLRQHTT